MRRRRPWFIGWAGLFAALGALTAPLARATADGTGRDAGARSGAPPMQKKGALPPGHPPTDADQGGLPPGHPPTGTPDTDEEEGEDENLPPGHPPTGPRQPPAARERLPEDTSDVDDQLPVGAIVVEVRDPSDQPVPRADVTLGILQQSVAKGESRRHVQRQADEGGNVRFDGLEFGGGVAYRITVPWGSPGGGEPATYAAPPFQLDLHHGQRVRIHLYPVTNRIAETMLGMDGIVYIELKDDVVQFDELFRVYNLGAVTWVPTDVVITLPAGFKGFVTQKEMSDAGWDEVPGRGAKLRGTFGPGQHQTQFRYQVPYSGDEAVEFSTSLPPHVARMRVMAEASKGMTLQVTDFPPSVTDRNQSGQRILLTERQLRAGEAPPSRLRMALDNIPIEGPAKWVATAIATATVLFGIYLALEQEKAKPKAQRRLADYDADRARARLVAEIAELDKARVAGELGPKAYEHIRSVLVDALARLMAPEEIARSA